MKRNYVLVVLIMCALIVGGCLNMGNSGDETQGGDDNTKDNGNDKQNAYEQENYIPIQEYTGEGLTLCDANPKTDDRAEEKREEVATEDEGFLKNRYNTK